MLAWCWMQVEPFPDCSGAHESNDGSTVVVETGVLVVGATTSALGFVVKNGLYINRRNRSFHPRVGRLESRN